MDVWILSDLKLHSVNQVIISLLIVIICNGSTAHFIQVP
jgi:hypothetical protein